MCIALRMSACGCVCAHTSVCELVPVGLRVSVWHEDLLPMWPWVLGLGFGPGSVTQTLTCLCEGSVKNEWVPHRPGRTSAGARDAHLPIELSSPPHI